MWGTCGTPEAKSESCQWADKTAGSTGISLYHNIWIEADFPLAPGGYRYESKSSLSM